MSSLSELEWHGVELALHRYFLDHPGHAMILTRLMRRPGVPLSPTALCAGSDLTVASVRVYICRLRDASEDLGFPPCIQTIPGQGYSISPSGASAILGRVYAAMGQTRAAA